MNAEGLHLLKCFSLSIGVYTGDTASEDCKLCVLERHCFLDLLAGLKWPCPCGMALNSWTLDSIVQKA